MSNGFKVNRFPFLGFVAVWHMGVFFLGDPQLGGFPFVILNQPKRGSSTKQTYLESPSEALKMVGRDPEIFWGWCVPGSGGSEGDTRWFNSGFVAALFRSPRKEPTVSRTPLHLSRNSAPWIGLWLSFFVQTLCPKNSHSWQKKLQLASQADVTRFTNVPGVSFCPLRSVVGHCPEYRGRDQPCCKGHGDSNIMVPTPWCHVVVQNEFRGTGPADGATGRLLFRGVGSKSRCPPIGCSLAFLQNRVSRKRHT